MKKMIIIFLIVCMFLNVGYAIDIGNDDVNMTLEEAVEYASEHNTTLIDLRRTLDSQEDVYDDAKKTYSKWKNKIRYSGGYSFEDTQDYLDCFGYSFELAELTYNNFLQNLKGTELNIKYTVKNLAYKIRQLKDSIILLEESIKKQESDLQIAEVKLKFNMITEDEFGSIKNTLETSKISLEDMKRTFDSVNISLKQILGMDVTKNLSIILSETACTEPLDIDAEKIIEDSLSSNTSVISAKIDYQKKYNNYILATKTKWLLKDESKDAKKAFSDAESRLTNEVNAVRDNLLLLYHEVKNSEKSVEIAKEELEIAKNKYDQAKIMYEVGLISRNSFLGYEISFLTSQNNYKAKLDEVSLLKDRWDIAIAVGDIINSK